MREFLASPVKPLQSPVPCRHLADGHRRVFLLARAPACCVSSHRILLQPEPEPLSPCLETTRAAGKAIGRRLCADPSSRRLPTLELDAVASLFKARCTDPSPHRCLKHALALPLPPFLDNPQSTRVHPVASTCTHRPSAPLAFERFSRASASTRVPLPSLSCASSSPFHLSKRQTHKP